jgi:hypothetical protein
MLSSSADFGKLSNYEKSVSDAVQRVQNEFGSKESNCISLDLTIKKLRDKLVSESLKSNKDNFYISALSDRKGVYESGFASNRCADKIEKSRQIESAVLLTKEAIKSEESILPKSNSEQKIYIGVGALILLVGLYIIVKK